MDGSAESQRPDHPAGGRGRPKDPARRAAIVAAARALFLEHGLVPVSMDAIAQAAGVSKRTIYSHFADKEALFGAVIAAEAGDFRAALPLPPPADLAEVRGRLIEYGVGLTALLTRPGILDLGRLIMSEARRHPELVKQFYAWGPEASLRHLTDALAEANALGLLAAEPPEVAADQLASMWQGRAHFRQQLGLCPPPSPEEMRLAVTRAVDVIIMAYAPPDRRSAARPDRHRKLGA